LHSPRFYCPKIGSATAELDDSESHHVLHVLRLNVGDEVELFDGTGNWALATISDVTRKTVRLAATEIHAAEPPKRPRLAVAAAAPRGDRMKSMVEKLTELGVDKFIPLRTVRSVTDPRQSKLDKLRGTVIAAMKQSRRNRLMTIQEPTEYSVVLRQASTEKQSIQIAHPGESSNRPMAGRGRDDTVLLIGPEGGFTREEVLQATDYGAHRIVWPEGILRIETATITFAGLLLNEMHHPS
jgi:16S rRNA (uracil1498-N3)-methyltransferase